MATIKEVAKKANVSIATVSRVLNGKGKYSKEVALRVLNAAKDLNYKIHIGARGLKTGKTMTIGISLPEYYLIQYPEMVNSIITELNNNSFHSDLLLNIKLKKLYEYIQEGRYDGVIIFNYEQDYKTVHNIVKEGIPSVFTFNEMDREDVNIITIDFFQAGYLATKHLIKNGHKNIMLIKKNSNSFALREIERGYLFAHDEYGIQYRENNILNLDITDSTEHLIKEIETLVKIKDGATAVITTDHYSTFSILKSLYISGLKVPEDISMVACGVRSKLTLAHPDITSIIIPIEQTARLSAEIVLNAILNNDKVVKRIKLMVQILEGNSVLKRLTKG